MAAAAAPRKTVSIYDYPEHLNPFREDDNHNKIRFWTLGKRMNRSNSINFSGIKDLKNSWAFRSFMKKGKKQNIDQEKNNNSQTNGHKENSPVIYRRAMQYSSMSRSTIGSPERPDRYVYGGSITPLPRSRFQERLRSPSNYEVNSVSSGTPRMARSEIGGSRVSIESTNPFDDGPVPPVRAPRRKKKRAPAPPAVADVSISSVESEIKTVQEKSDEVRTESRAEENLDETYLNVELKIVEDEELHSKTTIVDEKTDTENKKAEIEHKTETEKVPDDMPAQDSEVLEIVEVEISHPVQETVVSKSSSEDDIDDTEFPKVDIVKYRRNSSVNEDDIQLRRQNFENLNVISKTRSKSMNNDLNLSYITCEISLSEEKLDKDTNGNNEPQKVVCKLYDNRKLSVDNSISSTEREFIEIDKATRELEREITKMNSALRDDDDDDLIVQRMSVSEIKRKFDNNNVNTPNPIPKPRRSHHGSISPINGQ